MGHTLKQSNMFIFLYKERNINLQSLHLIKLNLLTLNITERTPK